MKRVAAIWVVAIGVCAGLLPLAGDATAQSGVSSGAPVSPKGATAGAAAEPAASAPAETEQSVSMFPIKGDKPLSIRSDELEALDEPAARARSGSSTVSGACRSMWSVDISTCPSGL